MDPALHLVWAAKQRNLSPFNRAAEANMKIVHVITRGDILGGAQSHVRELALELRSLGHEVTVITGAPGIFTGQLGQMRIPWLQVKSLVRPLKPHLDLAALFQLRNALRHLKPDLVCGHTAKAGSLARAAARLQNIPSVFTPHGWSLINRSSLKPQPLYCCAEALAGRLGTRVINVCEFERTFAQQFGVCPARTLDVVHNGISEIALPRARSIDAQPPLIVMVARFAPQKDHGTLLQALAGLLHMEWRLLLVGAGELEHRIYAQMATLGLEDRVRILPPQTDVGRLLMEAQIFVLSTNFEALPISILEAMRAGLPVVATNVGGISESVRHEETGLLVGRGDVDDLRRALASLIAHPALRVAMGTAGRRLWCAQFTASTMAARTVEVYKRALASP
jgi:glycosyltransferase involved in cell wall biosynthesis